MNQAAEPTIIQMSLTRMWGGAEIFEFILSESLMSRGYSVHFICRKNSPLEERLRLSRIPFSAIDCRDYFDPVAAFQVHNILKAHQTKWVVLHALKDLWIMRWALWGLSHVRCVGLLHTFVDKPKKKDIFHRWIYRRLNHLVCTTHEQKDAIAKCLPLNAEAYSVIPYWVDHLRFSPIAQNKTKKNVIRIGCVGRFEFAKGQLDLVQAVFLFKTKVTKPFHVELIGGDNPLEPSYRSRVVQAIKDWGLQKDISVFEYSEDIAEKIASLDLLIMPSHKESFGQVLLEAMASEVAVVSTRAGGVPGIVLDGETGLLAIPRDCEDLACKIATLIEDSALRKKCAVRGRQWVQEQFTQDINLKRWESVLETKKYQTYQHEPTGWQEHKRNETSLGV